MEAIRGDGITKSEMKQKSIRMIEGTRGGIEFHAPTYADKIATILLQKGIIEDKHLNAACDYIELKNSVFGFLNAKTMAGILQTGEAGVKRENAEAAYYIAARYIGRVSENVVLCAMNETADATLGMAMVANAYRSAFHAVFDGMDLAITKIREDIKNALRYV